MPIRPEEKEKYPRDWQAIRTQVLVRAQDKCEWEGCGVENYALGARDSTGRWWPADAIDMMEPTRRQVLFNVPYPDATTKPRIIRIVLTVAHLDHDPTNNSMDNLVALCQLHHNRYDVGHRVETRRRTLKEKLNPNLATVQEGWVQDPLPDPFEAGRNVEATDSQRG